MKTLALLFPIVIGWMCWFSTPLTLAEDNHAAIWRPTNLVYQAGPADNPLKGLVPYRRPYEDRFPCSMEFGYLPLSDLVVAENRYDFRKLEEMISDIASRGRQTVFRVYLEYPKRKGIPKFLIDQGLKVHRYENTNTAPFPPAPVETPDYEDPRLRRTLQQFIAEMGRRYDDDPRIAYITAGLLGTWGEWHTYPRTDLWASKTVQLEVLNAYQQAFDSTPILLRYPAGPKDPLYADTTSFPFGYHDDSFAHSTLETGREEDGWFFHTQMKRAGLSERWRQAPIGGEIRPEVWGCCFDDPPCTSDSQAFAKCRDVTHVTWLLDTGMFREPPTEDRYRRAIEAVSKMGYDLFIKHVQIESDQLSVLIENRGIAPFYAHGWQAKLRVAGKVIETDWSPRGIQPGETRTWSMSWLLLITDDRFQDGQRLEISLPNPMPGGRPLRFANQGGRTDRAGWFSLGHFTAPTGTAD